MPRTELNLHSGGELVTRDVLKTLPTPPATETWKPIPHYDLIAAIDRQLAVRDIRITSEQFALHRDGLRLFGVLELLVPGTNGGSGKEYAFAMGIRTANDRAFATSLIAGARIFVCSNLAFSGDFVAMNRRHTAGFDLNADLSKAVDRFERHLATFGGKLDALKARPLSEAEAKVLIFEAFHQDILPIRLFDTVAAAYLRPRDDMPDVAPRTMWGLHNAFTRALKQLAPAPAFAATSRLGQLFGLTSEN